jgi:hypothetical protein
MAGLFYHTRDGGIMRPMLDSKFVLENLDSVQHKLETRGRKIDFGPFLGLVERRKGVLLRAEGPSSSPG